MASRGDGKYKSPDGRIVEVISNLGILFSDDFGGSAVLSDRWQVIDGGQQAVTLGNGTVQGAIGSGITGMSDSVSGSQLVVSMGTTLGAERWYLSTAMFAGAEDLTLIITKSQAVTGNSIFVGLVEVDAATGYVMLNPNIAADGNGSSDMNNRGGVEFGKSSTATAYSCQAVADGSSLVASGTAGTAAQTFASGNEVTIEFHAEDIIASTAVTDGLAGKVATAARVAKQCPNDSRVYRLLMRFYNPTTPTATTVSIDRILMCDCQEQRVEVVSGRGDQIVAKAVPTNVVNQPAVSLATLSGATLIVSKSNSDALATQSASSTLEQLALLFGFNGSTFDRLRTINGALAAGTGNLAVEEAGRSYANITTATTTTVKSGAGFLHSIVVNTPIASATITIYDNTSASAPKIGTITLPSTITGEIPISLVYDLAFATGLTIVTSGATDLTVNYR